jgi:hypothetical protein
MEPTGDGKRIVIGNGLVEGPNGYEVAEVYSDDCPREVAEANARLIAAAPDMLSVLRFLLAFYEPGQTHLDTNAWKAAEASARAAVAKAEGR